MKPGYKTTEFWTSLAASVCGILVLFGVISPEQKQPLVDAVSQVAGGLLAGISVLGYAISRGKAKGGE